MTDYHDALYENARRNYRASGRSFHIPAAEYKRPTFLLVILAVVVAVALVGSVL